MMSQVMETGRLFRADETAKTQCGANGDRKSSTH